MNHLYQKPYECFPTVLAMLTGRTVTGIKREILGQGLKGESWSYLISNPCTDKFALLRTRVESFLSKHLPWLSIEAFHTTKPLKLDPSRFSLPASRGVLVTDKHVVAFESGLIFDPAHSQLFKWKDYQKHLVLKNKSINWVDTEK